jgi:hypothetical protein
MFAFRDQRGELYILPSLPSPILSLSPTSPSYLERSPSSEKPTHSTPSICCDAEDAPVPLSDVDLYHHYIQHTSRKMTHCQRDQIAIQIGIPKLALSNETVFHSLLALSAACIGCDMISRYPPPNFSAVNQVLMSGYRHYNLASEQLREMISQLDALKVEALLASNLLLVPFSAASQQIYHWISSRSETRKSQKLLSSTPKDLIVIMRGIKTMLQALDCRDSSPDLEIPGGVDFATDEPSSLVFNIPPAVSCKSYTHVMFPILAATSQEAFAQLQERLDSAERNASYERHPETPLSACVAAFAVLAARDHHCHFTRRCSDPIEGGANACLGHLRILVCAYVFG